MSTLARKGGVSLPEKRGNPKSAAGGKANSIVFTIAGHPIVSRGRKAASDAAYATKKLLQYLSKKKKLLQSTGKAAWIAGTTFLVFVVPLIIELDREQQLNELEVQQASLLGTPPLVPQQK